MKLKEIASLCKKGKHVYIATGEDGQQYIGDGKAAYRLEGLPRLDGEELMTLFDFKEKDKEKIRVTEKNGLPLDLGDYSEGERRMEATCFPFRYGGKELLPLSDGERLLLIAGRYLRPLEDNIEYLSFWRRRDAESGDYILIKNGLQAQAAVMPFALRDRGFVERAFSLANGLEREMAGGGAENEPPPEQTKL